MPAPFNPKNVVVFASTVSPIFITFFLIMDGALNGNVKFIVYLVGLFAAIILGHLIPIMRLSVKVALRLFAKQILVKNHNVFDW